mgnify:FL=1
MVCARVRVRVHTFIFLCLSSGKALESYIVVALVPVASLTYV